MLRELAFLTVLTVIPVAAYSVAASLGAFGGVIQANATSITQLKVLIEGGNSSSAW